MYKQHRYFCHRLRKLLCLLKTPVLSAKGGMFNEAILCSVNWCSETYITYSWFKEKLENAYKLY